MSIYVIIILSVIGVSIAMYYSNKRAKEQAKIKKEEEAIERRRYLMEQDEQRSRREEQERLRKHIDLVIQKNSHNFYNVMLKRGDGGIEYLHLLGKEFIQPNLPKELNKFFFTNYKDANNSISNFEEYQLPCLAVVIEHYKKYKTLLPIAEEVSVVPISRPEPQPLPQPTQMPLGQLIPILIEADNNGDNNTVNKVLDQIESLSTYEEV